jgi:hypothetical protein
MEDQIDPKWRKATYSGNGGSDCIEVGQSAGTVLVRDTKNRDGATLGIPVDAWRHFAAMLKNAD